MTARRGFLGAMLAACAAPAIVRADSLMRVIPRETEIILPPEPTIVLPGMDLRNCVVTTGEGHCLYVGDLVSIGDIARTFRVTSTSNRSMTLQPAQQSRPMRLLPADPWFRQHEKRGRR